MAEAIIQPSYRLFYIKEISMHKKHIIVLALITALLLTYACAGSGLQTEEPNMETGVSEATEATLENEELEATEEAEETGEPEATETPEETESVAANEGETGEICPAELETMFNSEGDSEAVYNSPETDKEFILVTYQIDGNEISSPKKEDNIPEEFVKYQNDTKTHEYLWKFYTDVIPASQRKDITEFILFTDGADNIIGAVDEADTPNTWTMEMDIIDAQDLPTFATTLIHEFGHVLTLNDTQISDNTTSCADYMTIDGCSKSSSYINAFYNAFWADIYKEWASTVEFSNGEVNEDAVITFYDQYSDQFLTDYAPTGPEEDIAESWIYFIFSQKPAGDTIAEQKILFFYDYPELVNLREEIRGGLCKYAPK
jgi:hypothetical protein